MLAKKLKDYNIILASGSPRRQSLLKDLDINFSVKLKSIKEEYPDTLKAAEITDYLSELKSKPYLKELNSNDILITSDTIVWLNNKALGKPKNYDEAFKMLSSLSNTNHEVITSVCISMGTQKNTIINDTVKVYFKELKQEEIDYYIKEYKPFDKAGSYGIQEWIGKIGINRIEGSYFTVMGFPVHKLYKELEKL
ncbi:septum formation protein [Tenacibaculum sp. MAR_2009_124]|uniref:Maf family nucleotide pyrophosphatase n=1 Tax=Tenacibaculum sp. MAR_2009_124 TaxID=1250059 RepID=UPI00089BB53B|nr:Maf family nucleotide pyrophosphatase [Tenacibaculum sp. MAR_2009_124]SEB39391.1 septum formation protein [Tenacibaculum sp. MAR_2009_124]